MSHPRTRKLLQGESRPVPRAAATWVFVRYRNGLVESRSHDLFSEDTRRVPCIQDDKVPSCDQHGDFSTAAVQFSLCGLMAEYERIEPELGWCRRLTRPPLSRRVSPPLGPCRGLITSKQREIQRRAHPSALLIRPDWSASSVEFGPFI
jgi:hypothetical protein